MAYNDGKIQLIADNTALTSAPWPGGRGVFSLASGTPGGSTTNLQWSPDGGTTWLDVDRSGDTYVTFTAVGSGLFDLPVCLIRANVSGGSPSGLNAFAMNVP